MWGVRKACAECFTQVACACSTDVRRKELAQTFLSLIRDQSRWVRHDRLCHMRILRKCAEKPAVNGATQHTSS